MRDCLLLASLRGLPFLSWHKKGSKKSQGCGEFWLCRGLPPWRAIQNSIALAGSNNGLLLRQGGSPLICLIWGWVPKFSNAEGGGRRKLAILWKKDSLLLASLRGVTFCLDAKSNQKDQGCEVISAPAEKAFGGSGRLARCASLKQVPELIPQMLFLL